MNIVHRSFRPARGGSADDASSGGAFEVMNEGESSHGDLNSIGLGTLVDLLDARGETARGSYLFLRMARRPRTLSVFRSCPAVAGNRAV